MQIIHSLWNSLQGHLRTHSAMPGDGVSPPEEGLYFSEDHFQRQLILERERARRFGMPFMLTLFNVGQLLEEKRQFKGKLLENLCQVLRSATREIDVKGWYIRDFLLGVIFPDVQPQDRNSVLSKINRKLDISLSGADTRKIDMLCLFYPESADEAIPYNAHAR
jgi:hypothetical protein